MLVIPQDCCVQATHFPILQSRRIAAAREKFHATNAAAAAASEAAAEAVALAAAASAAHSSGDRPIASMSLDEIRWELDA